MKFTLSHEDTSAFLAAVADLEQETDRALMGSSYSLDYTEIAGAITTISRIAALINEQADSQ